MVLFFFNGWYGKALEISGQLLTINERDRFALYYKALCETVRNKTDNAIEAYLSLLKIDNRIYSALMGLGRLYLKKGDFENAALSFHRVLEINPGIGAAYVDLGNIQSRKREYGKAVDLYLKALENNAEPLTVYPKLIMVLVETDEGGTIASSYCEKLEALFPDDPYSLDALGWASLRLEKSDKGLGMIQKAHSMVPDDPMILYHLGVAHYEEDNLEAAKKFLKASTDNSPNFPGYENAVSILRRLKAIPE